MPCFLGIVWLAVVVFIIASMWKVFVKAGRPGWESIVPIYNGYIIVTEIAKLEVLWFILFFIPIANIIALFKVNFAVAEKFGKDIGFGLGLVFLGFIFMPILGFGDAKCVGAAAAPAAPAPPVQQPPAQQQ